ncbi:MAG: hypothetical protein QNJ54_27205 [Prochloraceae cyanobacterium]|nr:hypothetical protein [Prochloraceae cyanobacterium]
MRKFYLAGQLIVTSEVPNRLDRIEAELDRNSQQLSQLTQTVQFLTSAQLEAGYLII